LPELPEVEVIARGLDTTLPGRAVGSVDLLWEACVATPAPADFARRVAGRQFVCAGRRGKFIILALDDGQHLLAHLRMTGRLYLISGQEAVEDPHVRAVLHLADGCDLRFADMRKFGRLYLVERPEEITGALGAEPLDPDFTSQRLADMLQQRRARLKFLLLDQRFIAGLGNIYVDEALFRAGLHPLRPSDSLTDEEGRRLWGAVRTVLQEAINRRGTTLSDYRDADGQPGQNQINLRVYGRKDQPCPICGSAIHRIVVGQRGTHYCPRCQRI